MVLIGALVILIVLSVLMKRFVAENQTRATLKAEALMERLIEEMQRPSDLSAEAIPNRIEANGV